MIQHPQQLLKMTDFTSVTVIDSTGEDEIKRPYYDYIEPDEENDFKTYRGFKYHSDFPDEWILDQKEGTGRDCANCVGNPGHAICEGKIIGYCTQCAEEYEFKRGPGFIESGKERIMQDVPSVFDIYLEGLDTESVYDAKVYPEEQTFTCKNSLCKEQITLTPYHKCPCCHYLYCKNGCSKLALIGCVECYDCFYNDKCKECNIDIDRVNHQCPKCLKKCCRYCPDTELVHSSDFCRDCYEPDYEEQEYDYSEDDGQFEDDEDVFTYDARTLKAFSPN